MTLAGWLAPWRRSAGGPAPDGRDADAEPPRPARRTYVVGDIHGRLDLLDDLLARIAADAGEQPHDRVFLGDYVDRGPDSAGVLARLADLETTRDDVTCLLGNHERMLLKTLEDPARHAAHWIAMGGDATLASFGVPLSVRRAGCEAASRHADRAARLAEALGPGMRDWLSARPLWWRCGTLVAVHALTDPARQMEAQREDVLLWARPDPRLEPRHDGSWVVHGHTIVPRPEIGRGHIAIDTGAYRSGRLTALVASPDAAPRFLQTGAAGHRAR